MRWQRRLGWRSPVLTERWPDIGDVGPTGPACRLHGDHRDRCCWCATIASHLSSICQGYSEPVHGWSCSRCCSDYGSWRRAKLNLLPRPFFAAPQSLLEVYTDDWPRLGDSTLHSLMLLVTGLRDRRGARLHHRCGDRMVARRRLLGASGAALRRPTAGDRLAAAGILCVSVELERRGVSDRPGDRVSRHRVDLVGCGECQRRLLRRGTNARRTPGLPDPQGRHPGRDAVGVRRAVHGPWRVIRGAGRGRDDGGEVGAGLVPELGTGLGRLFQHVCGTDRDGADVQRPDHAAVPHARPLLSWQKGLLRW